MSLGVDYRTHFFRNKVPWGTPDREGLHLFVLSGDMHTHIHTVTSVAKTKMDDRVVL